MNWKYIAFVLAIVAVPLQSLAQPFISDDQATITAGLMVSAGGAAVFSLINTLDLSHGGGDRLMGSMGVVFGLSLVAFTAVAQARDDTELDAPGVGYVLGGTSTLLGVLGWRRDAVSVEPEVSLTEACRMVGASVRFVF